MNIIHSPFTFHPFIFLEIGWLVLVSVGVVGLCVAGLAFNILVRKNGKFPETEIAKNKNVRQLGITCVKQDEINRWKKSHQENNTAAGCDNCTGCKP